MLQTFHGPAGQMPEEAARRIEKQCRKFGIATDPGLIIAACEAGRPVTIDVETHEERAAKKLAGRALHRVTRRAGIQHGFEAGLF